MRFILVSLFFCTFSFSGSAAVDSLALIEKARQIRSVVCNLKEPDILDMVNVVKKEIQSTNILDMVKVVKKDIQSTKYVEEVATILTILVALLLKQDHIDKALKDSAQNLGAPIISFPITKRLGSFLLMPTQTTYTANHLCLAMQLWLYSIDSSYASEGSDSLSKNSFLTLARSMGHYTRESGLIRVLELEEWDRFKEYAQTLHVGRLYLAWFDDLPE